MHAEAAKGDPERLARAALLVGGGDGAEPRAAVEVLPTGVQLRFLEERHGG